jgi:hypothetical protein
MRVVPVAILLALFSTPTLAPSPATLTTNPTLGLPISPHDVRTSPYSSIGTYLGRLYANKYDPESVANPYGQHGSPYSATSIRSPYSVYGSPYSALSPNNPYAMQPPAVIYRQRQPTPTGP